MHKASHNMALDVVITALFLEQSKGSLPDTMDLGVGFGRLGCSGTCCGRPVSVLAKFARPW